MQRGISILISCIFAVFAFSVPVFGAGYDTQPQITFSNKDEIQTSVYSDYGRWDSGKSKYTGYEESGFTYYEMAKIVGQKGIPVAIVVTDPDHGQVLTATVTIQSRVYNVCWGSLSGYTTAPTGSAIAGYVFIPLGHLTNTTGTTLTVTLNNYENNGDATPISTKTATTVVRVDRTAPVAGVTIAGNTLRINTCNELPAKLFIQHRDVRGVWAPAVAYRITTTPTAYIYESLTNPQAQVQYWVEDMAGNATVKNTTVLTVSADKFTYSGFSEETRVTYAAFVGVRLTSSEQIQSTYYDFLGGI